MFKNSKYALGAGLLILGVAFVVINYFTITYNDTYLPKLLLTGFIIAFMGIGLLLFPGVAIDPANRSGYWKKLWKEAKILNRVMWIVFTLTGAAVGIWTFIYFDLNVV